MAQLLGPAQYHVGSDASVLIELPNKIVSNKAHWNPIEVSIFVMAMITLPFFQIEMIVNLLN